MPTIQQDDLFKLKFLQGAVLSPDASQVAYIVAHHDADDDKDLHTLHLLDVASGTHKQMTAGKETLGGLAYTPDGGKIGFMSDRAGKPQLFALAVDGGEAQQLTELEQGVRSGPIWSPDGEQVAFMAGLTEAQMPDLKEPYRVTRNVYRFDSMGMIDAAVQHLYVMPASGGEPRQLTHEATITAYAHWSPDSSRILYGEAMRPDTWMGASPLVRIVEVASGEITPHLDDWGLVGAARWHSNGEALVFMGTPDGKPIGSKNDLYVLSLANGAIENRTAGLLYGVGGGLQPDMPAAGLFASAAFLVKDDAAYAKVQQGGTVQIYRVALAGDEAFAPVLAGDFGRYLLDIQQDGILTANVDFNSPPNLYLAKTDGRDEYQLTRINDDFLQTLDLPEVERLVWPGVDGVEVEGWFMKPPGASAPYPTVLYIHGGPHGAFGHMFSFDFQMLAGAGYGVLAINHRASTGYGDDFSTAIKGDWGNLDYQDLMTGVDYAIEQGLADADKLGVCGLSGGGNLSCWIVGQTQRFKAAVPENPVTNWVSFYGVSDIGVYFAVEELGGHPHEIPEIYAKCSPITYAHRCTTPTLLVQGENDYRCPAEQSEQFYNVLRANGCTVEMLRLPGSPHAGAITGRPSLRREQNKALLGWMDRYVLGKAPQEPEADATTEAEPT